MCSLNIFQVSLGGLFVFLYLCLLRRHFFFLPEKLEVKEMMTIFASALQLGNFLHYTRETALLASFPKCISFQCIM